MNLYCGIDLHSTNNVMCILNDQGKKIYSKRLSNDIELLKTVLGEYKDELESVIVESTYNWYYLVDELSGEGYPVKLANTGQMTYPKGMKHTNDDKDAFHLAEEDRIGKLPVGHIYPKEERALRDLLRKRHQLVQTGTRHKLSLKNNILRNSWQNLSAATLTKLDSKALRELFSDPNLIMAMEADLTLIRCITEQVKQIEKAVVAQLKPNEDFRRLQTIPGIGPILAMTIILETGDITRFEKVGNFSSYCRVVKSEYISNGKVKGRGNSNNGNAYLEWAFMEATQAAINHSEQIQRYYQRKAAKKCPVLARKAIAHKLARASYIILKNKEEFDMRLLFG